MTRKAAIILTLALVAASLLSLLTCAAASATVSAGVDTSKISAGDSFTLTLKLRDNPGIIALRLFVEYDDRYFTIDSVTDGKLLGTASHSDNFNKSPYTCFWSNPLIKEDITENGSIIKIKFTASSKTPKGTYDFDVSLNKYDALTYELDEIGGRFDTVGTKVTVGSSATTPTVSDDDPTLTVSDAKATAGGEVVVTLKLEHNPGIIALRTLLDFNDKYFKVKSVSDGGILGDFISGDVSGKAPLTLFWSNPLLTKDITDNGKLVTVVFSVDKNTPAGSYKFTASSEATDIVNAKLDEIGDDFGFVDGTVTVTAGSSSGKTDGSKTDDSKTDDSKTDTDKLPDGCKLTLENGVVSAVIANPVISYGDNRKLVNLDAQLLENTLAAAAKQYPGKKVNVTVTTDDETNIASVPLGEFIVNIPQGYAKLLTGDRFTFATVYGSVGFDKEAIAALAAKKKAVQLVYLDRKLDSLPGEYADKFDNGYKYYDRSMSEELGAGKLTVTLPYSVVNELVGKYSVVYTVDGEKIENLGSEVSYSDGQVSFEVTKLTGYIVTVEDFGFKDMKDHWAREAVIYVATRGIFNGKSETEFDPEGVMTRGMLVTVLGRLEGINVENYNCAFEDVDKNMYYAPYIEWARREKIVGGVGENKFEPDRMVTRQEMAVIIARYLDFKQVASDGKDYGFGDAKTIDSWAVLSVNKMANLGIITGIDGNFEPKGSATRAQTATILRRVQKLFD